MPDGQPSNGSRRFEDLRIKVDQIDAKVDSQAETLAKIETLLQVRPCIVHDEQLRVLQRSVDRLEAGAQVKVAKIGSLSAAIAALLTGLGHWLINWGK